MTRALSSYHYADEALCVDGLLQNLPWDEARSLAVGVKAEALVRQIRSYKAPAGQIESFLQQYSLTTKEGLALMALAEALLRIPDRKTANALIRDKVAAADWAKNSNVQDWMVKTAGMGMLVTRHALDSVFSKIGEPFIREAMMKAMRMMGGQFVLGEDIESAVQNAQPLVTKGYRISYDILGEGARTASDAERYFDSYRHAINYVGQRGDTNDPRRAAMSVKLSALHPRYSYAQKERCVPLMTERLGALAKEAASYNIPLTVDAEEADRLEISLEIIEAVLREYVPSGWEGFGLAVQAYQKRALPVIDHIAALAKDSKRIVQVRLVKGAYWDTEVKRAQIGGLSDYPVFTRKANTDVSYMAGAHKLFQNAAYLYPFFATHNAHTAAAIIEMARDANAQFEFQRLFGMGEALHETLLQEKGILAGIYAPVGPHEDLLAYLVRRLLENGANTSFVHRVLNPNAPVEEVVRDPVNIVRKQNSRRHPGVPMPLAIYANEAPAGRRNSAGMDLSAPTRVEPLLKNMAQFSRPYEAIPLIGGKSYKEGVPETVKNPADHRNPVGLVWPASANLCNKAVEIAHEAFPKWMATPAAERAAILDRFADLMEANMHELMELCVREAGRTVPDSLAELREAVDFARYYANKGRADFAETGQMMPGATGEDNILTLQGRGVFVCIAPWNFPLAIFAGQVVAALMAGNCVIAKPAEQTPVIAMRAVQLLHEAGVPKDVLHYLPGDGRTGAALVAHAKVAGVAFTGSTAVAQEINRTLAAKNGPIVPLIAETGGQNAMIVDSTALPEQVVDDVLISAFGSAGQRCSSLRVLFLQEDIADKVLRLLQGAMAEISIGAPGKLASDVGPVIDEEALGKLVQHKAALKGFGKFICEAPMDSTLSSQGHYFAPCVYEIDSLASLQQEVFGPILHVIRYREQDLDDVIEQINNTGYGLTLGVHTRIESFYKEITARVRAGNAYVNRSMIGAVVGTQPFGGNGLSGTGPKAGGPHYLARFAAEKVVSINTTATGGNTSLVSLGD